MKTWVAKTHIVLSQRDMNMWPFVCYCMYMC